MEVDPVVDNQNAAEPSRAPKPANGSNLMDAVTLGLGNGIRSELRDAPKRD